MGRRPTDTTKGGKAMNPTDAWRKQQRRQEIKKNKKQRALVRDNSIKMRDPKVLYRDIYELKKLHREGTLNTETRVKKLEETLEKVAEVYKAEAPKRYEEYLVWKGLFTEDMMTQELQERRRQEEADAAELEEATELANMLEMENGDNDDDDDDDDDDAVPLPDEHDGDDDAEIPLPEPPTPDPGQQPPHPGPTGVQPGNGGGGGADIRRPLPWMQRPVGAPDMPWNQPSPYGQDGGVGHQGHGPGYTPYRPPVLPPGTQPPPGFGRAGPPVSHLGTGISGPPPGAPVGRGRGNGNPPMQMSRDQRRQRREEQDPLTKDLPQEEPAIPVGKPAHVYNSVRPAINPAPSPFAPISQPTPAPAPAAEKKATTLSAAPQVRDRKAMLTKMVPASLRVKRTNKPKPQPRRRPISSMAMSGATGMAAPSRPEEENKDAAYADFLDSVKHLL